MELEYNGVRLELLTLDRVERRSVYTPDGMDLLYIEWLIGAACVYARGGYPVATAVEDISDDTRRAAYGGARRGSVRGTDPHETILTQTENLHGGPDQWDAGRIGVLTDLEIRGRLQTPRRPLVIRALDENGKYVEWLRAPRGPDAVDAANGPFPISVDVVSAQGNGDTLGVYFQVRTCLTPCPTGSDRLVLAHRWQMSHKQDENFYLTRVIQGEITFNGAVLAASGLHPDDVRNQFIHPIPLGFRRGVPDITQSSDGLTLSYTITDTDQTVTFDPADSGAAKMSIVEKVAYQSPWGL